MRSAPTTTSGFGDALTRRQPWSAHVDLQAAMMWPISDIVTCRLSDMPGHYADQEAELALLQSDDPLIYRAEEIIAPGTRGELHTSITTIFPGRVGDEYFMSKGHYQVRADAVKVYLCLTGSGYLLTQNTQGETHEFEMSPGTLVYCAADWAQRAVNTGNSPFAYFKYWPAEGEHDYQRIIDEGGFRKRVLTGSDGPIITATR